MSSKVYAIDFRTSFSENIYAKLVRLLEAAGLPQVIKKGDLAAIKLHFGELGNTGYISPPLAAQVVEQVKALGGRPFLTDANTLYNGRRREAVSHLETAVKNGFAMSVVGAPLVIADGLKGGSYAEVELGGQEIKTAYVARDIAEADSLVSLAHLKGHELAGFGGALKNLGMGCAAVRGKLAQHAMLAPRVVAKRCIGCGECLPVCAQAAIRLTKAEDGLKAAINAEKCVGCGECLLTCAQAAIQVSWKTEVPLFMRKMMEYAAAAMRGKEGRMLFVNFVNKVTPACDCFNHSDAAIVGDVGVLASLDPVAVDLAGMDLVNAQPGFAASALKNGHAPGADKFKDLYPHIDWRYQLEYAEKIGLGSTDYELTWLENKA